MLERVGDQFDPERPPELGLVPQPETTAGQIDWVTNAKIAGGLAVAGTASFFGERYGINKDLPPLLRQSANSWAHLDLGYLGGMAVATADALAVKLRGTEITAKAYGVAATLTTAFLNTDAELLQSRRTSWQYNPVSSENIGESIKDVGFAMLGLGLFYALNRRRDLQRFFPKRFINT